MTQIADELLSIMQDNEITQVHEIKKWARKHTSSALYKELKFDDTEGAAELWRKHRIRQLIAIHIVNDKSQRQYLSISYDRLAGGGYRSVDDIKEVPDLRDSMLADALAELKRVERKYEYCKELAGVWRAAAAVSVKKRRPRRGDHDEARV